MEVVENKRIDVFFTIDNNYTYILKVVLASILYNAKVDDELHFYVFANDLNEKSKNVLRALKHIKDYSIEFVEIDDKVFDCWREHGCSYVSRASYYRLLVSSLMPNLDKCIFFDADLVAVTSLRELMNVDIENEYMAACTDAGMIFNEPHRKNLDLPLDYNYKNLGVILLNLKKWREDNIEAKLFEYSVKYYDKLLWPDQDVMNNALYPKIKELPYCWNVTPLIGRGHCRLFRNEIKIMHWAMNFKPWNCYDVCYEDYFWKYAKIAGVDKYLKFKRFTRNFKEKLQKSNRNIALMYRIYS